MEKRTQIHHRNIALQGIKKRLHAQNYLRPLIDMPWVMGSAFVVSKTCEPGFPNSQKRAIFGWAVHVSL